MPVSNCKALSRRAALPRQPADTMALGQHLASVSCRLGGPSTHVTPTLAHCELGTHSHKQPSCRARRAPSGLMPCRQEAAVAVAAISRHRAQQPDRARRAAVNPPSSHQRSSSSEIALSRARNACAQAAALSSASVTPSGLMPCRQEAAVAGNGVTGTDLFVGVIAPIYQYARYICK